MLLLRTVVYHALYYSTISWYSSNGCTLESLSLSWGALHFSDFLPAALLYLITLTPLIGPYQLTTLALISLSSTYFRDKAAKQQRLKALRLGPGLFRGRTSPSLPGLGFSPISNKSTVPEHDITSVTHLIPTLDQGWTILPELPEPSSGTRKTVTRQLHSFLATKRTPLVAFIFLIIRGR